MLKLLEPPKEKGVKDQPQNREFDTFASAIPNAPRLSKYEAISEGTPASPQLSSKNPRVHPMAETGMAPRAFFLRSEAVDP